ncbi:hypothetical protein CIG1485E_1678 [Campylobacter iguaniorum]|uniref:Outer membrane lipoprotein carrier protein LolA n=1 Tax=Campylobacter iguaniorum TaxID=1244531 RepID=A0A076FDL8_9BACT|nr:outer membrane lipoprotein carrier protein LolA [Campylobacter iguaniorum]AII15487.1 hypothetical protein CIG1485E_1678 [Campylobacter iguaniorum]
MKFIFCLLVGVSVSVSSLFGFNEKGIKNLIKTDQVEGNFTQTKTIQGFKNSIISSGTFSIINGTFEQNTTKPTKFSIRVSKEGIFEFDGENYRKIELIFDEELFLNMLNVNLTALKSDFDFIISGDEPSWQIELNPKNIIAKIFKQITISGDKFVKTIKLDEAGGDVTIYSFKVGDI